MGEDTVSRRSRGSVSQEDRKEIEGAEAAIETLPLEEQGDEKEIAPENMETVRPEA